MAVPDETPVTMPDEETTVATDVVEDAHVPPVTVLVSVDVLPMQALNVPPIEPAVAEVVTDIVKVETTVPQTPDTL